MNKCFPVLKDYSVTFKLHFSYLYVCFEDKTLFCLVPPEFPSNYLIISEVYWEENTIYNC